LEPTQVPKAKRVVKTTGCWGGGWEECLAGQRKSRKVEKHIKKRTPHRWWGMGNASSAQNNGASSSREKNRKHLFRPPGRIKAVKKTGIGRKKVNTSTKKKITKGFESKGDKKDRRKKWGNKTIDDRNIAIDQKREKGSIRQNRDRELYTTTPSRMSGLWRVQPGPTRPEMGKTPWTPNANNPELKKSGCGEVAHDLFREWIKKGPTFEKADYREISKKWAMKNGKKKKKERGEGKVDNLSERITRGGPW